MQVLKNVLIVLETIGIPLKPHGTSSTIHCFAKFRPLSKHLNSGRLNVMTDLIS